MLAWALVAPSLPEQARACLAVTNVTDTELTVWGIGLMQNIDAAATELYLSYRQLQRGRDRLHS